MPSNPHTTTNASPLLRLPPELRQNIYTHLCANAHQVKLRPPPYSRKIFTHTPGQTLFWSKLQRPTLGLTQVCRQLRGEFLPLHQQNTTIVLNDPRAWKKYIADFLPRPEKARGTLHLCTRVDGGAVDVAPLIRLSHAAPGLSIVFPDGGQSEREALKVLFGGTGNLVWRQYAAMYVVRVMYTAHYRMPRLVVEVSAEAREDWMSEEAKVVRHSRTTRWGEVLWEESRDQFAHGDAVKWKGRVGLGKLELPVGGLEVKVGGDGTATFEVAIRGGRVAELGS